MNESGGAHLVFERDDDLVSPEPDAEDLAVKAELSNPLALVVVPDENLLDGEGGELAASDHREEVAAEEHLHGAHPAVLAQRSLALLLRSIALTADAKVAPNLNNHQRANANTHTQRERERERERGREGERESTEENGDDGDDEPKEEEAGEREKARSQQVRPKGVQSVCPAHCKHACARVEGKQATARVSARTARERTDAWIPPDGATVRRSPRQLFRRGVFILLQSAWRVLCLGSSVLGGLPFP